MNESTLVPREECESGLDWLARNVHVWPDGKGECLVVRSKNPYPIWSVCKSNCGWIERSEWLARRAELQNKPSWKGAPEWANWLAQDAHGDWWWHKETPKTRSSEFDSTGAKESNTGEVLGDWRDTLEKRPEGNARSMSGVHSNGDMETLLDELNDIDESIFGDVFIPKDAATAKQQAPKGSGNPILGMVLADLTNRALEGMEKYGEPLLAHNGRNPLWDAYQEALDLAMYLRQAIEEQK